MADPANVWCKASWANFCRLAVCRKVLDICFCVFGALLLHQRWWHFHDILCQVSQLTSKRIYLQPAVPTSCDQCCTWTYLLILHLSLNINLGLPLALLPSAICPYRNCFGIRLSSNLVTWPSHLSRRLHRMVGMVWRLALLRTSVLVFLSSKVMPRILRRHLRWKMFSLFSCPAYDVHVSDP